MSRASVEALIERWTQDLDFRAELRADPEGTVRRLGLPLSEEEWEALRTIDWSLSDQELELRVNKAM